MSRILTVTLLLAPLTAAQLHPQATENPRQITHTSDLARALAVTSPTHPPPLESDVNPVPLPRLGGWTRWAKWLALGTAAALGTTGILLNEEANDRFAELEGRCLEDPDECRRRTPDGAYANLELEALFQSVLDKDAQARLSLIASQVTFGASIAFFIIDFQRSDEPENIPYEPDREQSRLQLSALPGAVMIRYYIE